MDPWIHLLLDLVLELLLVLPFLLLLYRPYHVLRAPSTIT